MAPRVSWTVTSQRQSQEFDQHGTPVNGKIVSFQTDTGYSGTVFVPDAVYGNAQHVKDMISAEVASVAAIHGLSGTSG